VGAATTPVERSMNSNSNGNEYKDKILIFKYFKYNEFGTSTLNSEYMITV
jgi:hypothetical protein